MVGSTVNEEEEPDFSRFWWEDQEPGEEDNDEKDCED
jgi:hypothetical protein